MKIIARPEAFKNLESFIGQDLSIKAQEFGITTFKNGKQNKGWKGLVLERLAGLETNVSKAPNGLTFELKSVSFHHVKCELVPKETMAITMINPDELKAHSFFESHCWAKLKVMIFCPVMWRGRNSQKAELLGVTNLDFLESDVLVKEIEADYDFIRNKLITQGYSSLTGKDGKWIQARTKGSGHGSTSRAFYARKALIKKFYTQSL